MSVRLLVDAAEFWPAFLEDARNAERRLLVQVLTFEADPAGRKLADLFLSLEPRVERRLIVDHYARYIVNDRFLYSPRALVDRGLWREARATYRLVDALGRQGVGIRWANPIGWRLYRLSARNHKKIFVVDDRVAYIGGINLSDHNFAWHDLMIRIDDPALVRFLAEDFLETFAGRNQALNRSFEEGRVILLDGLDGSEPLKEVFDLIASARNEVFVESPYVSAPFFDALQAAARRGVRVVILVPEVNNWGWYDAYARTECHRRGLELHYYQGPMNHLKAALIDSRVLITGSSNFDYFAYHTHQELLFVTTHEGLVRDFRQRVRDTDFARARRVPLNGGFSWRTRWTATRVRAGYPALVWFNRNV
jgi:cardiolipin synthase